MKDPFSQWKSVDIEGIGQVLLIEFIEWASKNSLDTDVDENLIKKSVIVAE